MSPTGSGINICPQLVALFGKLMVRCSLAGGSIFLCTGFESLKFCATSCLLSLFVIQDVSPQLPAPATMPSLQSCLALL